jgi:hypothetical protein
MTTDLTVNDKRLMAIAKTIAEAHKEFLALAGRSLAKAKGIGDLLVEAKSMVARGDWSAWLETYFPGSERSAQGYMRLSNRWDEIETKSAETADLTIDAAMKFLAKPKPEPELATEPGRKCRNCGGTEFDEDGDCTECREPKSPPPDDDPAESPTTPQDATDDEEASEDDEAKEDAGDGEQANEKGIFKRLLDYCAEFHETQCPDMSPVAFAAVLYSVADEIREMP